MTRKTISLLLSAAFTAGLLLFVFSRVSLEEVLDVIVAADRRWVATFLLCSFAMSVFSAWRYLLLLEVVGYRAPRFAMYLVVLVRNLGSDLLPARIGTLIYVFLTTTRLAVPMPAALTSFGYAFAFDFVAMAPLILLAAFFALGEGALSPSVFVMGGVVLLLLTGGAVLALPILLRKVECVLGPRLPRRHAQLVQSVRANVEQVAHAGILGRVFLLSISVRVAKYLGLYCFLIALLAPRGYQLSELPFPKMFLGMSAAELSASLPIAGVAGLGTYQSTWIGVFSMLGFPLDLAALTSISHHLFTQAYGYSLGVLALLLLLLPWFRRTTPLAKRDIPSLRSFSMRWIAVTAVFIAVLTGTTMAGEHTPRTFTVQRAVDRERLSQLLSNGETIIFDGRRGDSFGLFELHADGSVHTLVDAPARHEMFPSLSPDGQLVVFADARGAGRYAESQIVLLERKSGAVRTIAPNGTFPSFTADGGAILFERERRAVIRVALHGGEEEEIFPGLFADQWRGFEIVKPRMSPDGVHLAFTSDRGGRWHVWVVNLRDGKARKVAHGCQPSFIDADRLLFVRNNGAQDNAGLYTYSLTEGTLRELLDEAGQFGLEYFPRAAGGRVVYSATSPDQHSHERGNYQLFMLDVATGARQRLTFDTGTNRWPLVASSLALSE